MFVYTHSNLRPFFTATSFCEQLFFDIFSFDYFSTNIRVGPLSLRSALV